VTSRQDISREAHELHTPSVRAVFAALKPPLTHSADENFVSTSLPNVLPPSRGELALWRAFLSDEIEAILKGE
jgi:hypothetical protein